MLLKIHEAVIVYREESANTEPNDIAYSSTNYAAKKYGTQTYFEDVSIFRLIYQFTYAPMNRNIIIQSTNLLRHFCHLINFFTFTLLFKPRQ